MCFLNSAHVAIAASSAARNAINQKWNQVQKWQEKQDHRLNAIEREAERLLNKQRPSSSPCPQVNEKKRRILSLHTISIKHSTFSLAAIR
jgi:hypothetical protein